MPDAPLEELPRFIAPILASTAPARTGQGWALEVTWDGIRAQLRFDAHGVCVRSRPGRNCTAEFPELAELQSTLGGRRVIVDGELVFPPGRRQADFATLRGRLAGGSRRATGSRDGQLVFMAFDVLHLDGRAVRHLPYWRRRELLAELELDGPVCRAPRHFVAEGETP